MRLRAGAESDTDAGICQDGPGLETRVNCVEITRQVGGTVDNDGDACCGKRIGKHPGLGATDDDGFDRIVRRQADDDLDVAGAIDVEDHRAFTLEHRDQRVHVRGAYGIVAPVAALVGSFILPVVACIVESGSQSLHGLRARAGSKRATGVAEVGDNRYAMPGEKAVAVAQLDNRCQSRQDLARVALGIRAAARPRSDQRPRNAVHPLYRDNDRTTVISFHDVETGGIICASLGRVVGCLDSTDFAEAELTHGAEQSGRDDLTAGIDLRGIRGNADACTDSSYAAIFNDDRRVLERAVSTDRMHCRTGDGR